MADACEHPETEMRREWAERWLSPSRLSSYLDLCGGDVELALELHEWDLMLGRALMGDIAHFELALRNAYDRALTERFEGLRRELTRNAPHHAKEQGEKTARREHGEPPSHRRRPRKLPHLPTETQAFWPMSFEIGSWLFLYRGVMILPKVKLDLSFRSIS